MAHFLFENSRSVAFAFFLLGRYTKTQLIVGNPGPIFFAVFFLSFLLLRGLIRSTSRQLRAVFVLCGILSACAYIAIIALNVDRVGMLWHDEANILTIAAAYTRGQPIYHAPAAPVFYSLFYGPSTFLVYAPFLTNFVHPIFAMRLAVFAASLLVLVSLFIILRVRLSRSVTLALLPIGTAFILAYPIVLLGTRGDIWLLLCIALSLLITLRSKWLGWLGAAVVSGIFSGLAIDFKATLVPLACFLLAVIYRRHGFRASIVFGFSCAVSTIALFLIPGISWSNYLAWLVIAGHQRLLRSTLFENIVAASFLIGPIIFLVMFGAAAHRPHRLGWVLPSCCAVALAACIITGSKDGAGGWHLWPMVPFLLAGAAYEASLRGADSVGAANLSSQAEDGTPASNRTLVVLAAIAVAGACATMYYAITDFQAVSPSMGSQWRSKEHVAESALNTILHRPFPDHSLAMGYGAVVTDYRTDLRFELPLAGQKYFLDENAVVEGTKAGFPIPSKVTERILGCDDIWIIPHGEVPFSTKRNGILPITGTPYLFPDAIRLGFANTHIPFEVGEVYDLWKCASNKIRPAR